MRVDFQDILGGVFTSIAARLMLMLAAVWIGCTMGAVALEVGRIANHGGWNIRTGLSDIWFTPLLAFNGWGLLNIPFLLFTMVFLVFTDRPGYFAWGIIMGVESLAVMGGWAHEMNFEWVAQLAAWASWLILLAMLETGVWLVYQSNMNRWAREIGLLRMENRQRRDVMVTDDEDEVSREPEHSADDGS